MNIINTGERVLEKGKAGGNSMKDAGCEVPEEHGGNIYKVSEELAVPEERLIDFSASINPLGISSRVENAITGNLKALVHYPDPDTKKLRKAVSSHHNIDAETVLCGNGSTELIYLLPRALRPQRVLVMAPTFSEYERACQLSNRAGVKRYELKRENDFELDIDSFISALEGCDMAFLCNPNNPTGSLTGRDEVLKIAGAARTAGCVLVVDEAFVDFTPDESVVHAVQDNRYLAVVRSMTKFYGLTGLRVGYGIFHRDLMGTLRKSREPWTVNTLAQKAAVAALEDKAFADETLRMIKREKMFMENTFRELGITFFPSSANYYLLNIENGSDIVSHLRKKGILVRSCSNFAGLDGSYIRVAVKSHEHNKTLLGELSALCRA